MAWKLIRCFQVILDPARQGMKSDSILLKIWNGFFVVQFLITDERKGQEFCLIRYRARSAAQCDKATNDACYRLIDSGLIEEAFQSKNQFRYFVLSDPGWRYIIRLMDKKGPKWRPTSTR